MAGKVDLGQHLKEDYIYAYLYIYHKALPQSNTVMLLKRCCPLHHIRALVNSRSAHSSMLRYNPKPRGHAPGLYTKAGVRRDANPTGFGTTVARTPTGKIFWESAW